ncbi:vWA domain-containing protein [Cryptosporangium japonicum]|uniref:VWA domain-containing protein n=1 Tax=Cryptosporangium japonicum TaxID=80872 RepID=A0ABN0V0C9_9ACTN
MTAVKSKCLPTYLVIDTSLSMESHQDLLNDTVEHVFTVIGDNPRVSEFAHLSVVTFSTAPHVVLEMSDIEHVTEIPVLECSGSTNYGPLFSLLRQRIDQDVEQLNAGGRRAVLRPAVFILTDGEPMDQNWTGPLAALVDRGWRRYPHIISYGFGDANEAVLGQIATRMAFLAVNVEREKEAIVSMMTSLLKTLVESAGADEFRIPTEVPGYRTVPVEIIE